MNKKPSKKKRPPRKSYKVEERADDFDERHPRLKKKAVRPSDDWKRRRNVYVPPDLADRMDVFSNKVNWSAVAANAFLAKVEELEGAR